MMGRNGAYLSMIFSQPSSSSSRKRNNYINPLTDQRSSAFFTSNYQLYSLATGIPYHGESNNQLYLFSKILCV